MGIKTLHGVSWFFVIFFSIIWVRPAGAEYGGTTAQYLWVKEPIAETRFRAQMALGLLDSPGLTGSRGTPVLNYIGFDWAMNPEFGVSLEIPLAGTLSKGMDEYGIGNIQLGAKYVWEGQPIQWALGVDLYLPTAQNRSQIGLFTRPFVQFVNDQTAISPYAVASYVWDRLAITVDLGSDLQAFTKSLPSRDRVEYLVFYDVGGAYSFDANVWATLEFGGYSTLSLGNNQTVWFAGPGIRYQDYELSLGLHVALPVRSPAKDVIDLITYFDFQILF